MSKILIKTLIEREYKNKAVSCHTAFFWFFELKQSLYTLEENSNVVCILVPGAGISAFHLISGDFEFYNDDDDIYFSSDDYLYLDRESFLYNHEEHKSIIRDLENKFCV